jgi:hypothetical protein
MGGRWQLGQELKGMQFILARKAEDRQQEGRALHELGI